MKKTIRKKMMRDLQQAFVGDPPRLLDQDGQVARLDDVLKFTDSGQDEQRLMDLLRGDSDDSGHGSSSSSSESHPPPPKHKQFRSMRERPVRRYPGVLAESSDQEVILQSQYLGMVEAKSTSHMPPQQLSEDEDAIVVATKAIVIEQHEIKAKKKRRSFWDILIGKKKRKN